MRPVGGYLSQCFKFLSVLSGVLQLLRQVLLGATSLNPGNKAGWLVGRIPSPFSTEIGYIREKVLGGHSVPPG